jgi:uncharacterized protein (TIGR02246 family)
MVLEPGIVRKEVEEAQLLWLKAAENSDADLYASLMTEDFFCVTLDGLRLSRDQFLEGVRKVDRQIRKLSLSGLSLRFYPETAIVSGVIEFHAQVDGKPFDGPMAVTGVWIRQQDRWKCACYHLSDIRQRMAWDAMFKK